MAETIFDYTALEDLANKIIQKYKETLDARGITASGALKNSMVYKPEVKDSTYTIAFQLASYWENIENGRGPSKGGGSGQLKVAILKWIKEKGITPYAVNHRIPTQEQLAFLISRKIHREGYEGKHPLRDTITALESDINKTISNMGDKLMIELSKEIDKLVK